jgi:hypothetical protein
VVRETNSEPYLLIDVIKWHNSIVAVRFGKETHRVVGLALSRSEE